MIQYRVDHPQRGQGPLRSTGEPVFENGKVVRLIGNTLDITEQENATQELKRREAYLAEAQSAQSHRQLRMEFNDRELIWSDETFRILGYE